MTHVSAKVQANIIEARQLVASATSDGERYVIESKQGEIVIFDTKVAQVIVRATSYPCTDGEYEYAVVSSVNRDWGYTPTATWATSPDEAAANVIASWVL